MLSNEHFSNQSLPTQDEPEEFGQLVSPIGVGDKYDWDMLLIMNDQRMQTIEQARQFLDGSETVEFRGLSKVDRLKAVRLPSAFSLTT